MKTSNRIFAAILIVIAGFTGGTVLLISWRVFALALVSLLTLVYGLSFWRNTYTGEDLSSEKGFWRTKLSPAVLIPILSLAFGGAISGWLYQVFF